MLLRCIGIVGTAALVACYSVDKSESAESEEGRVRAVAQEIIAADNARDLERVLAVYAEDALLMPPHEDPPYDRDRRLPQS